MVVEIKRRFRLHPVGFRFDAMAAWLMCQQYGIDIDGMDKIPKDEYSDSWVWSAHVSFCILKKPHPWRYMTYKKMKCFIARMRKSEWDMLLAAMAAVRATDDDKKKAQPGGNSLSQDGKPD